MIVIIAIIVTSVGTVQIVLNVLIHQARTIATPVKCALIAQIAIDVNIVGNVPNVRT